MILQWGKGFFPVQVKFKQMAEGVHGPEGGCGRRNAEGDGGVQNGDSGKKMPVADADFLPGCLIGEHHAVVGFRARAGDSGHGDNRQGTLDAFFPLEKSPDIVACQGSCGNGLGAVNDAAASHGDNNPDPVFLRQGNALLDVAYNWVRLDACMLDNLDPGLAQGMMDSLVNPQPFQALSAGNQQGLGANGRGLLACLAKGALAEDDLGRVVKNKVAHGGSAWGAVGHGVGQADKILNGQPLRPGFRIDPRLAEQGGHLLPR